MWVELIQAGNGQMFPLCTQGFPLRVRVVIRSNTTYSGFGASLWYPRSRVQTRPKPSDFSERKNPHVVDLRHVKDP